MNQPPLHWSKYVFLARYHLKFLGLCLLGGLVVGLVLNMTLIRPMFGSHAKLLIRGGKTTTFITPLETDPEVHSLTMNGNPLLTQIEVLSSVELAGRVLGAMDSTVSPKLLRRYKEQYPQFFMPESLVKAFKFKNPASTDVITLDLKTPDKRLSKLLVGTYVSEYQAFLQDLNHKSLENQGQYIHDQIRATEDQLKAVRKQLRQYRLANNTIDLQNEAQASIQQITELESQRIALESQVAARSRSVANMRRVLGMSSTQGVQSVALGMNATLMDSQKALNAAMQEYDALAVKYTDQNPTVQALKARIEQIKNQMATETQRTLGRSSLSGGQRIQISDPVRSGLVNNLATAEAELRGLQAQRATLAANLARLKGQSKAFPEKQLRLAELLESERVLSDMVTLLKQKAAEADFQASNELSNVVVIQPATLPRKADFPTPMQVLALCMMLGLASGMGWLLFKEWVRMQIIAPMARQLASIQHPHGMAPMKG